MDSRSIVYRQGMPFYPVTFPANEADGLLIEDLQLQQLVKYLNQHDIKSGYICSLESYDFLRQCTSLEYVTIELKVLPKHYSLLEQKGKQLLRKYDITPLYDLQNLKSLSIVDIEEPFITSKIKIDLGRFVKLERFSGKNKYIANISQAKNLKTLRLNDYEKDTLHEFTELEGLDTLELNRTKIKTLDGCEKLTNLQCLYLYYNRTLSDISALKHVKHSIKALRIENCAKIKDFSVLEELEELELLELWGSNEIPSISFIKKLKNLKTFIFSVNILDGDITPCLNLKYAFCGKGRKYYNLRDEKLPKGEYIRGNENIEMWRRFE